MVLLSAAIVDADKTVARQIASLKNYAQAGSEISRFIHPN